MKKLLAAFAAVALVVPAVRADDKTADKTIAEIAMANPDFSTLVTALKAADLADVLNKADGTFTVFAPTNAAFEKIAKGKLDALLADKEKLTKVLMAHVIKDKKVTAADVKAMEGKKMPCGHTVKCEGDKCMLVRGSETITVKKADILAKNGIVHVIDTVIIPDSVLNSRGDR